MLGPTDPIDIVARTLWGEARGEGQTGMHAVGCVIHNRAKIAKHYYAIHGKRHPLFGDGGLIGVCRAPMQFSCWGRSDPNRVKLERVTDEDSDFEVALKISRHVYAGDLEPIVGGCTHYLTDTLYNSAACPSWAKAMKLYRVLGNHVFLLDKANA